MRKAILGSLVLAGAAFLVGLRADDRTPTTHESSKAGKHLVIKPGDLKWAPAASLPAGAELAVLEGDPTKAGASYVLRARLPDGFKVPPHWHPVDEIVTVLQGTLLLGKGDQFSADALEELPAGSFSHMPRGKHHFAEAKGETILQVHGTGPFAINYVNPEDDPRKKTSAK